MSPKLYTYKESGNSYKVRLLAALLHVDLEEVELNFMNGEHRLDKFLSINPRGEIPTLVDGDRTLTDSASILVYIAGTHSDPGTSETPSSFWSTDAVDQAAIVEWLAFSAGWIKNGVCNARSILTFRSNSDGSVPEKLERALQEAKDLGERSLVLLEKKLEKDKWLALGRPTIADISVFVYIALAPMGGISLESFPAVKRWIARVRALPRFIPIDGLDDPTYRSRG